nr:hypothetical protein [Tanacetum cinerariifolium]
MIQSVTCQQNVLRYSTASSYSVVLVNVVKFYSVPQITTYALLSQHRLRSREARDGIFSQLYRLRSLKREQERAKVTFGALWRQVLALKAWTGHVDAQRAEMGQAWYDDHRSIHDLLVQNTMMQ